MATYILVSGAWHAGWCWERVVPRLAAQGHQVLAPDLAGMGPDRTPISTVSLSVWADQIARLVREQHGPVVLVGHSRGGIVISEAAERVPDHIAALVYVAAFLVPSGESLASTAQKVPRDHEAGFVINPQNGTITLQPDVVGPMFYNTTEKPWVERALSLLTPEPAGVFTTPLRLSGSGFGSVRRIYVECTQDRAIPLDLQRLMQADLPCETVFTIETDHSPFYSASELLVQCLAKMA